ncbi:MAG: hypothetical protein HEQ39_11025 [Rhizobacter sp.]
MAWKPAYAELGAVSSDWSKGTIQMPFVRSQTAEVAARINEALYLRILGTPAPLSAGKTFELADGTEPPAGTSWQKVGAVRNDGRIFSVTLEAEGCGAYCEAYSETHSFDSRSGRALTLEEILTPTARLEVPKRMIAERIKQYRGQIKVLKRDLQALKLKKQSTPDAISDLESRIGLNEDCLSQEREKQKERNSLWFSLESLRFSFPDGKGVVFTSQRCSNHASRALDDVGDVDLFLSLEELPKLLTPYGRFVLLDSEAVPEPRTPLNQVLRGQIGGAAVTFLLTTSRYGASETSVSGLYYYDKYRKPIGLSGKIDGVMLSLTDHSDANGRMTMALRLGQSGLSGQWRSDSKTLPVMLSTGINKSR